MNPPSFAALGSRQTAGQRRDAPSQTLKFSKKRLALAFAIAGISDVSLALSRPWHRQSFGWWILEPLCCCSWCWVGSGCCCRDWLWRQFRASGRFQSGCLWLGPPLFWALLGQSLTSTDRTGSGRSTRRRITYRLAVSRQNGALGELPYRSVKTRPKPSYYGALPSAPRVSEDRSLTEGCCV